MALSALVALLAVFLTVVGVTNLWWMVYAWVTPERLERTRFGQAQPAQRFPSYSLIVPARHEEAVLEATLSRLASLDYPDVEVLAVVGHDDPGTKEVAQAVATRYPGRVKVVVDHHWPKNKPKALNTALPHCRGEVVGVFDAEDEVHPDLLRRIGERFLATGADVVQGGVQLMNYWSTWWSLHNVLEYYFWFRSRLHFHAERRFIPLGGNTVFVRRERLVAAGGWDNGCLAEDCELGVRLSARGSLVSVAYDPELVTREETPPTLRALLRQRTRWNQGYLQVLRKGEWRRLPTCGQRAFAWYTLAMPFLQALTGLVVPFSILTAVLSKLPVAIALLSFVPAAPIALTLAIEVVALSEFTRAYGRRARPLDYARLVVGLVFYQLLLAYAALRAVAREVRGEKSWDKTTHVGAHRLPLRAPRPAE